MVSLRDLHEGLNNLIQMPSVQQALSQGEGENWVNELLDESLRLVDLCGFSRVVCLTKESIQDLESSIRRNEVKSHRKRHQCLCGLKKEDQQDGRIKAKNWSLLSKFAQTKRVHSEAEQETAAENLCSLNIHKSRKGMDNITLKQLKSAEMSIQELEEGLEALFRSLVKTRVSLLNVLSH
ncbi:UNVERIFIED_CONTAM: hypothetical protein Slati_2313800 [Sesamum latifolium]|uniref:Uncharacterized protein n=1 Tax=Sesamum latifolium TaxID=2727402 RepID=A0AAW2W9V3_9LAMI